MAKQSTTTPVYETATLPNGLRIVHQLSDSPVMYCGIMVDCGTRDELRPERFGLAHFVEHILFKGTQTRDSWHINNRMESVGGELNAFTNKEETTYYAIGLNKDFNRACELICDLVCHPVAPQHELEKEREVVVDEIMSYKDTPAELIYDEFENRLWSASHPCSALGHNILGDETTVRSFDHNTCIDWIDENYTSDKMIFFHQGKTPFDRVCKTVEKWYENSRRNRTSLRSRAQAPGLTSSEPADTIIDMGTHQAHVLIGAPSYPIGHPNAAALALLNNVLGGPGMNSRLGLELRERRGLVYTVESTVYNYTDTGYVGIYFGCDHDDIDRCKRICLRQLEKLSEDGLSPRQLQNAQKQLCGQLGVSRANLENNAIAMAKQQLRLGHVESLDETCQRITDVTATRLAEVAREIFNRQNLKTVIIK